MSTFRTFSDECFWNIVVEQSDFSLCHKHSFVCILSSVIEQIAVNITDSLQMKDTAGQQSVFRRWLFQAELLSIPLQAQWARACTFTRVHDHTRTHNTQKDPLDSDQPVAENSSSQLTTLAKENLAPAVFEPAIPSYERLRSTT